MLSVAASSSSLQILACAFISSCGSAGGFTISYDPPSLVTSLQNFSPPITSLVEPSLYVILYLAIIYPTSTGNINTAPLPPAAPQAEEVANPAPPPPPTEPCPPPTDCAEFHPKPCPPQKGAAGADT